MFWSTRMRSITIGIAASAALALAALSSAASPAAASSTGVNDWSCTPSAAHPQPVVLWHGLGSNGPTDMGTMAQFLAGKGYCTFYRTYGTTYYGPYTGGLASMRTSAVQLQSFVNQVLQATKAPQVDIVGHSEGTTVPAYYLKFLGGAAKVKHFAGFGSNFQGTSLDGLETLSGLLGFQPILASGGCQACNEFAPTSSFMADLNAGGVSVAGPEYTSIVTKYDEAVTPYTSGVLPAAGNVTNVTLQDVCSDDFSGHIALAIDPNIESIVANALDPANATPVRCIPMPWVS